MKITIEITDYDYESIKECGFIPDECNEDITKAILNGEVEDEGWIKQRSMAWQGFSCLRVCI